MINNPIIYKFFKDFTYHRKKNNRVDTGIFEGDSFFMKRWGQFFNRGGELSVTYPQPFWADWYIHLTYEGASMVGAEHFLKFVPPDALKMHSLALSVLRFLCKTFSKLLKFTLSNTPLHG